MVTTQSREYLINKVQTATPIELVIIVYDTAIGSLEVAKELWEEKNLTGATEKIIKSQKCIRELIRALNKDVTEISGQLMALYRFMDKQLNKACRERNPETVDRVIKMLLELRETWKEVAKKEKSTHSRAQAAGINYINAYK